MNAWTACASVFVASSADLARIWEEPATKVQVSISAANEYLPQ